MRKSIMDKVFDVLAEENRRFARLQEEGARLKSPTAKPQINQMELIEAKRRHEKKDFKLSRYA